MAEERSRIGNWTPDEAAERWPGIRFDTRALATISQSCDTCAWIDAVVVASFVGSPSRRTTTEKRGAGMLSPAAARGA